MIIYSYTYKIRSRLLYYNNGYYYVWWFVLQEDFQASHDTKYMMVVQLILSIIATTYFLFQYALFTG